MIRRQKGKWKFVEKGVGREILWGRKGHKKQIWKVALLIEEGSMGREGR